VGLLNSERRSCCGGRRRRLLADVHRCRAQRDQRPTTCPNL
jgi:hypothetical protein